MALKYHINNNGEAGICRAKKVACRFGGENGQQNHYNTLQEAQEAAEAQLSKSDSIVPRLTVKKSLESQISHQTNVSESNITSSPTSRAKDKITFFNNIDLKSVEEIVDFANESKSNYKILENEINTRDAQTEQRQWLIQRGNERNINHETLLSAERDLETYRDKTAELIDAYKSSNFYEKDSNN